MAIRLTLIMIVILISFFTLYIHSKKYVMINFGDSNSDSGENVYTTGTLLRYLYGQLFDFHQPTSRYSNGRIYLDFLCESLEIPHLSPYLQLLGSDFSHGVNFPYWGSVTEDKKTKRPYPLPTQINQFIFFQNFTRILRSQGKGPMITDQEFGDAIYAIDIGQNDLSSAFNGTEYSVIETTIIPKILENIENAVKNLYNVGARKYYLYNTGPLGCLPIVAFGNSTSYSNDRDGASCKIVYNDGSKAFNKGFAILCDKLRSELMGTTIVCVDKYSIKHDLFAHLSDYGFTSTIDVTVDWSHYNEAASKIIASKILSGAFSQPQIKLTHLCAH